MYCLRYWARYVRKGEVKSGGIKIGNESASWTLCAEVVLAIQHLLGCCILGETSQRRSAPVPKFSQLRAWISIRERVSRLSPNSVVYFFFLYKLIIFKSIIQFFFMLFPLLLCLHQQLASPNALYISCRTLSLYPFLKAFLAT